MLPIKVKTISFDLNSPGIKIPPKVRPNKIGYICLYIYKSNYLYILKYFVQEENPFMWILYKLLFPSWNLWLKAAVSEGVSFNEEVKPLFWHIYDIFI